MIITMSSETWESWRAGEHNVPRVRVDPNVCLFAGVRACTAMFSVVFVCDGCVNVCVCVNAFFLSVHPCAYVWVFKRERECLYKRQHPE